MRKVTIYTDGACSGNGQDDARGGWAAIAILDGSDVPPKERSGGERAATNQRMEIRSVIEGLKLLKADVPCTVVVRSDSAYVVNCMTDRWYRKWRTNGWLNSKKEPVANRDLWEELLSVVEERDLHEITFIKVKGHADKLGRASDAHERFNQRCDELAVAAVPV